MPRIERNWEPWETAYLVQNAHRMPLEEVAVRLGRSQESVKAKAKRLRSYGKDVGPLLKCGEVPLVCRECGEPRYTVNRSGVCAICVEEAKLARSKRRYIEAVLSIPKGERARRYGDGPGALDVESKVDEPEPDPSDKPAHERWEAARLWRKARAMARRANNAERTARHFVDFVNGKNN